MPWKLDADDIWHRIFSIGYLKTIVWLWKTPLMKKLSLSVYIYTYCTCWEKLYRGCFKKMLHFKMSINSWNCYKKSGNLASFVILLVFTLKREINKPGITNMLKNEQIKSWMKSNINGSFKEVSLRWLNTLSWNGKCIFWARKLNIQMLG